ncbi:hypothetical protein PV945_22045, partial [Bacillus subtilis]|nr:hypothetical protein [Bacillus subtilis]
GRNSPVNRLLRLAEVAPYHTRYEQQTRSVKTAGFLFDPLTHKGSIEKSFYMSMLHHKNVGTRW